MALSVGECRLNSGDVMQHKYAWAVSALSLALLSPVAAPAQITSTGLAQPKPLSPIPVPPVPVSRPAEPGPDTASPPPIPVPPVPRNASMREALAMEAQVGFPGSQYELGDMYARGREVPKDTAAAVVWYTKAADRGYAQAEFGLGEIYFGDGPSQDYAVAAGWFRKAADQGYGLGQNFLGNMYAKGQGVPQDLVQAYIWLDLATQATTGQIWGDGYVEDRDAIAAKMTTDQIARAKQQVAAWEPAPATPAQQVTAGFVDYDTGKYAEALSILTPLAEGGDPFAQFTLGLMYHDGSGVVANDVKAAAWFRKAADLGHAGAQSFLGNMYRHGTGVPQDDTLAATWNQKAAEQGLGIAQMTLGGMYLSGKGLPKDGVKAVFWMRKAANQGLDGAQYILGDMSATGFGTGKPDLPAAYKWLRLCILNTSDPEFRNDATQSLAKVSSQMTSDQMTLIEAAIKSWQPVYEVP